MVGPPVCECVHIDRPQVLKRGSGIARPRNGLMRAEARRLVTGTNSEVPALHAISIQSNSGLSQGFYPILSGRLRVQKTECMSRWPAGGRCRR
jgi:hypothetical protein